MRIRIPGVLVALFIAGGVLAVAAPAQATSDGPAVIPAWSCGPGEIKVDPKDHDGPIRLLVDADVIWTADKLAEAVSVPVEPGTVVAEIKVKGEWKKTGSDHVWKLPGWCKPLDVKVEDPTCECLDLIVKVSNPNKHGWLWVKFGDDKPVKVKAGDSLTVKVRADVTVSAGWHWKSLKVIKEIDYTAPDCATPSPSPSPSPGPESTPTPTPAVTTPAQMSPSPLPSVVPAGQVGGKPSLPVTGASVTGVVIAGLIAVAGGIFLVTWMRRRRPGRHFAA